MAKLVKGAVHDHHYGTPGSSTVPDTSSQPSCNSNYEMIGQSANRILLSHHYYLINHYINHYIFQALIYYDANLITAHLNHDT